MKSAAAKHVNSCNVAKIHVTVKDGSCNSKIFLPETDAFQYIQGQPAAVIRLWVWSFRLDAALSKGEGGS